MNSTLRGVLPVAALPFQTDGAIDYGALKNEIDWILEQGANGVVMGMVSESLRLSSEERDAVAAAIATGVGNRGSSTATVGADSTYTAVRHAKHAEAAGATAVMAIPPVSVAAAEEEIFRYYAALVDAVDIPVIVQDASGYLGTPLSVALQARLYTSLGEQVRFKPEAQPIGPKLSALRDATGGRAEIFEGTGGLAVVDSFARGIKGTMPGPDLVWALVRLWEALESGDRERVDALHGPICALVSIQTSLDSFVSVQKHLLRRQGVLSNTVSRGPVAFSLDPETIAEVDRLFDLVHDVAFQGA